MDSTDTVRQMFILAITRFKKSSRGRASFSKSGRIWPLRSHQRDLLLPPRGGRWWWWWWQHRRLAPSCHRSPRGVLQFRVRRPPQSALYCGRLLQPGPTGIPFRQCLPTMCVPHYQSWASESAFRHSLQLRLVSEDSGTGLGPIILSSTCVPNIVALARSSVADPHHLDADPDPDPACHFDTDPDPDPAFHFEADPDPS